MNDKNFSDKIKEYRVFSLSACIFISWMFYEITMWITAFGIEELTALGTGAGVAISGIFASISASYKFVYDFARNKENKEENGK